MEKGSTEIYITIDGYENDNSDPDAEETAIILTETIKILKFLTAELYNDVQIPITIAEATHSSPLTLGFACEENLAIKYYETTKKILINPRIIEKDEKAKFVYKSLKKIGETTKKIGCYKLKIKDGRSLQIGKKEYDALKTIENIFNYSYSTFTGVLEFMNIHTKKNKRFNVYDALGHSVSCIATPQMENAIINAVAQNVCVYGRAKYELGEFIPKEIDVEKIDIIQKPIKDLSLLKNCIPHIDELPHEYINKLRSEWL